jgi:hypothetical protein
MKMRGLGPPPHSTIVTLTKVRVQLGAEDMKLDSGFRRNDEKGLL